MLSPQHEREFRLLSGSSFVLMFGMHYRAAECEASPTLEAALSAPLDDLQHRDRERRSAAFAALASILAGRMRCYDIRAEEDVGNHAEGVAAHIR